MDASAIYNFLDMKYRSSYKSSVVKGDAAPLFHYYKSCLKEGFILIIQGYYDYMRNNGKYNNMIS